jgi:hypothetical protein
MCIHVDYYTPAPRRGRGIYCFIIPPLSPKGEGGILFYLGPSKIFFVAFFSVTVDGRNLILVTSVI